ncbi:Eco57I restriction-modification methylase domain-containing protein [Undibacterium amnicola]|uniref:site-specific DNA-methyltransferase (adenine-specific) n=1 Tax=Undibacterium amnicola TaxID=1834038 RepID=A0ABR6XQ43_9BURK|nr:Eco57I restriction-modification methylase domain-containing protein [Undibacterium amnicola]MBC3831576.1 Eco57I restriction-modification methylase domain-containing protein [Undibacterium amnicola]
MINFAHSIGRAFVATLSREAQKSMGQFMTPPEIATFMARRIVAGADEPVARILEPSAGAGILAAAVVHELLLKECPPERIELLMFELDERLIGGLKQLARVMHDACEKQNIVFDWKILQEDFLLSELATSGVAGESLLIVSNPPYFKLNKSDPRAIAHSYAVYGQPNIYGLFMAACARLAAGGGKWCFITPRSWMSGSYFAAVRRTIFSHLNIDALHSFESRRDHFSEEAILQEAVITWATGFAEVDSRMSVIVTRSVGVVDMEKAIVQALPLTRLIGSDFGRAVALPMSNDATQFDIWTATLETYGLKVSTGPVVPFRSLKYIREFPEQGTVPLLWMQHVSTNGVKWPIQKKREYILSDAGSSWMLVKNTPMVLMRRFSPNENARRINVTAYAGDLPSEVIGLENHLNYIYRVGGSMSVEEARGLSAFLGSRMVDQQFRSTAGSTQVNAADLRKIKLPPIMQICAIGRMIQSGSSLDEIDAAVEQVLGEFPCILQRA